MSKAVLKRYWDILFGFITRTLEKSKNNVYLKPKLNRLKANVILDA